MSGKLQMMKLALRTNRKKLVKDIRKRMQVRGDEFIVPRENGKPIQTYLYYPNDKPTRALPVVFNIHGGAWVGGDALLLDTQSGMLSDTYEQYLVDDTGVIQPGHQAAYIRALALDMVSEEKKPLIVKQLKKELEAANYHLNTGFLSTVYLLPTLVDNGLVDEAFLILEQTDSPGWLHPIKMGATTVLENWDGMDVYRDSFNHYSFGAVCQFLFEYVAGIRPTFEGPGFQIFKLHPIVGGSLTWAKASYKSQYGMIESSWKRNKNSFTYTCTIPQGTTAHLILPNGKQHMLTGGKYSFRETI